MLTDRTLNENSNILNYDRNGKPGQISMDRLSYAYTRTNGKLQSNRLLRVNDAGTASGSQNDMEDQIDELNYVYDKIGNLVKDKQINQDISWSVYGKIKRINKATGQYIGYNYDAGSNRVYKESTKENGFLSKTWYVRDAQGNVLATYGNKENDSYIYWKEQHIYGASRIGIWEPDIKADNSTDATPAIWNELGKKKYELSNYLGNVLATVSDKKMQVAPTSASAITGYKAEVVSMQDYYPFGMMQPGRYGALEKKDDKYIFEEDRSGYRYGFNGKENDNEIAGDGNQQDYGMRIYDPRLGRFLSVDPIAIDYPWNSTYAFAENEPIANIDLDGLEKTSAINKPNTGQVLERIHYRKLLDNMVVLTSAKCHPSGQVISDQMNARRRDAISKLDFKNGQLALPRSFIENLILDQRTVGSLDYQLPPEAGLRFSRELIDKDGYATGMFAPITGTPPDLGFGPPSARLLAGIRATNVTRSPGWLMLHEGERLGHTVIKHVNKTDGWLLQRLANEPHITASSSFTNLGVAESVISTTIEANQARIATWLSGSSNATLTLPYTGAAVIGRSVVRGETVVREVTNANIILKKLPGGGYHVNTAYPKL